MVVWWLRIMDYRSLPSADRVANMTMANYDGSLNQINTMQLLVKE